MVALKLPFPKLALNRDAFHALMLPKLKGSNMVALANLGRHMQQVVITAPLRYKN